MTQQIIVNPKQYIGYVLRDTKSGQKALEKGNPFAAAMAKAIDKKAAARL